MDRVLCLLVVLPALAAAQDAGTYGPSRGSLLLQGGVGDNQAIDSAFAALAGGAGSHIVVIPTASVGDAGPPGMESFLVRRNRERFGVAAVSVLHALDRATSDSDRFVEALRGATGVWILGGFPERLVQSYVGTKTERAIRELLDRGGVVGGESAGAMIQGAWLDNTDDGFKPGGFGLLTRAAIFPHFDKRGGEAASRFRAEHPDHLGFGIDDETAVIVKGNRAEVVGRGTVSVYDGRRGAAKPVVLRSGDRYDLGALRQALQ